MPRAEVGSTKHIANQMKSKGLQRLRWWCQACQRQMRDENGFKCHVASESHVRNMQVIGEDPRKAINDFSSQFQRDFLQLLRTGHGEKKVNLNHFYQEYISNKEHVHMNSTKWTSLSEFAKHLGRGGICRVEEDEKQLEKGVTGASSLMISWIDNSPENLRRQEALKKRERQDKGDEELEQRMIREQIRRAKRGLNADEEDDEVEDVEEEESTAEGIKRNNGEKVVLNFGAKKQAEPEKPPSPPLTDKEESSDKGQKSASPEVDTTKSAAPAVVAKPGLKPISFGASSKPKNVFAAAGKKNALAGAKKPAAGMPQRPMSEAERIMKEELERKQRKDTFGGHAFKRQRLT
jgi:DNA/RNA-binding protein KIN17